MLHSLLRRLNLNFIKASIITFPVSLALLLLITILFFYRGVNFGVDFTGGTIMEIRSLDGYFNLSNLRDQFKKAGVQNSTIQYLNNDDHAIIIKLKENEGLETIKKLMQNVTYDKIDYVGPQVSSELIYKGLLAVFLALAGMFLYLLIRFNWCFALSGILALIHDVVMSIGFFIITQMEFNIPSIAAILTIIGYSINDSVVIFDRIREFLQKKYIFPEVINRAINSTLIRTTLTSFTTMLAAIPLIIVGKGTLHDFSLVILFGVIVGTYSSIFVAGPMLKLLPADH